MITTMLDEALELAQGGFRILPCKPTGEQAKAPLIANGFKNASNDITQVQSWWSQWPNALIAVAIPDHLTVIDIDPRNGGSLEALEQITGPLPDTLSTWSGRNDGGHHLWFNKPSAEITTRNRVKGVDVKPGGSGYVIVPPSPHPVTGQPYRWGAIGVVADLPQQAVQALQPPKPVGPPLMDHAVPESSHSGAGIVRRLAEAVEGERNDVLSWAAWTAYNDGLDDLIPEIIETARAIGLDESEITATVRSAYNAPRQEPKPFTPQREPALAVTGNRAAQPVQPAPTGHPLPDTPGPDAQGENPNDPLGTAFSASSLMQQEFAPLEYVVPGVIPEGLTMLVAPPKIGKSWMVLGLAKACSEGSTAFDAIQVDQRPVLYLALEDGQRRLQARLNTLGMGTGNDDLTMMVDVPAGAALTIGTFVERNAHRKPLVILDTLGKVRDVYGGNDSYQKDYAEMSMLKRMVDDHPGSSLVIVHHTNKGAHGDFVSSVSGTQGITGAADSVLTIERGRSEDDATLNVTSRDAAEGSYAITLNDGAWSLDGYDLTEAAQRHKTRAVTEGTGDATTTLIGELGAFPEGIRAKDLAQVLYWTEDKTGRYLRRAHESNRVQKLDRGLYAPLPL